MATIYLFQDNLKVYTSNIFKTIDTATCGSIPRIIIGHTAGTTRISIIITTITLITMTIDTIDATAGATSVIKINSSDTGAGVSEFKIR